MLNVGQFKNLVVAPTLSLLPIGGLKTAVNLVTGTALVESRLTYLRQVPNGPALGVFQMEFATYTDIWKNFLAYRKPLAEVVKGLRVAGLTESENLIMNLAYAAAMCRVHYLRSSDPMPDADDALGMAKLWKKHYNTIHGAGKVEHATPLFKQAIES